ncbi:glycosyltransferase [Patescibacteria group bacterium]
MRFSVIIPSRAINDHLKETVSKLKKVSYYDFEVIIVLDKFIKVNFGLRETRFKVIASGNVHPGEKRNLGAKEATGDVLAFLDDDAYPESGWLRAAANIFRDEPDLYALGGPAITPIQVDYEEEMAGRVLESYMSGGFTTYRHKVSKRRDIDDYPTVNLFVKKEAFDAVGGFDMNYWPGEDTKLCLDLVKHHERDFLYDPAPVVYHHRRKMYKPFYQQVARYGQHRGWFARVFPQNSRKLAYFVPSLFVLGLVGGLVGIFLIPKLWTVYALVIFLYLTMVFSEAQKVSMNERDFNAFRFVFLGIIGTNLHYGINFIKGFLVRPKSEAREIDESSGNYQGG